MPTIACLQFDGRSGLHGAKSGKKPVSVSILIHRLWWTEINLAHSGDLGGNWYVGRKAWKSVRSIRGGIRPTCAFRTPLWTRKEVTCRTIYITYNFIAVEEMHLIFRQFCVFKLPAMVRATLFR